MFQAPPSGQILKPNKPITRSPTTIFKLLGPRVFARGQKNKKGKKKEKKNFFLKSLQSVTCVTFTKLF